MILYIYLARASLVFLAFAGITSLVYYGTWSLSNLVAISDESLTQNLKEIRNIGICRPLIMAQADISTIDEYSSFDFTSNWTHFWEDGGFEKRYLAGQAKNASRPPLKVILVPHSHNDAGWLITFDEYFTSHTSKILSSLVTKLKKLPKMTFVWNDIAFLQKWWDQAQEGQKKDFKELVDSGRLEITTGGWVMPDEATSRYYPLLDQLIEGHQWLKANLNVTPRVGWAIDPFGHGSTMNYLLGEMGFEGTAIQRVHHLWKHRLAMNQWGDFIWKTNWERKSKESPMITHHLPFYSYSTVRSCGPDEYTCMLFDFADVSKDSSSYHQLLGSTEEDLIASVSNLLRQYSKSGSLFKHNVVMVPLGDDFRYSTELEFDRQYGNYMLLLTLVNENPKLFNNSRIEFGTPKEYFEEIKRREKEFPTLTGDFYPYADPLSDRSLDYWTGYYSTRPIYKRLGRELEHNLRAAEILYTLAYNKANQRQSMKVMKELQMGYGGLVEARRNLGIFQHHDGVTGTSRDMVMEDYGRRLVEGINITMRLQEIAIGWLVSEEGREKEKGGTNGSYSTKAFALNERKNFKDILRIKKFNITQDGANKTIEFMVYNSLAKERVEVVTLRVSQPNVKIFDPQGEEVLIQVNPVWEVRSEDGGWEGKAMISEKEFEVLFVAKLPQMSLVTYSIQYDENSLSSGTTTIYCNDCNSEVKRPFDIHEKEEVFIQLQNRRLKLLFDKETGLLKTLSKGPKFAVMKTFSMFFGAYQSVREHSGAYLFKPARDTFDEIVNYNSSKVQIVIVTGPIASEVVVRYDSVLMHTVRIFHSSTELDEMVYIENDVNLSVDTRYRDKEFYMRIQTDVDNGEVPKFFTDANSFQYQMRQRVNDTGVEANYYPITSGMFIQDERTRVTLLTDHSMGGTSFERGQLEVMMDRRMTTDDRRGMVQAVEDSVLARHRFWLLVEEFVQKKADREEKENQGDRTVKLEQEAQQNVIQTLSWEAQQRTDSLNYPLNLFLIEGGEIQSKWLNKTVQLLNEDFPCDVHLVTARTMTDPNNPGVPMKEALLVLFNQPYSCSLTKRVRCSPRKPMGRDLFAGVVTNATTVKSLTGVETKTQVYSVFDWEIPKNEIRSFKLSFGC